MSSLWSTIKSYFSGDVLTHIKNNSEVDEEKILASVKDSLSFLLGGISKNTHTESRLEAFSHALEQDHDGSIFSNVSDYLSHPEQGNGKKILNHIFGSRVDYIEDTIAEMNNLDPKTASVLMENVAPLLMGALGKIKKEDHLGSHDIAQLIQNTFDELKQKDESKYAFILRYLDKDGDGEVLDDIKGFGFLNWVLKFFRK